MPWNVGRDAGEKFSEAAQFVVGIVEAGNEQRDNLQPQSHLMNSPNAVEDGADASAEFVVMAIVETLEIHFVEIEPGTHIFKYLGSSVAVGDKSGKQAGWLSPL